MLPSSKVAGSRHLWSWSRCPEVRFEAVHTRSKVFQAQVVIHRVSQFLFASEVILGRLNRCMAKQELNLFKFSPS